MLTLLPHQLDPCLYSRPPPNQNPTLNRTPRVQAFLLADRVYRDQDSQKMIIAGTFNQFSGRSWPTGYACPVFAFVALTDFVGRADFTLRLVDNENMNVLMQSDGISLEGQDPLRVTEVAIQIAPFPMPHPGTYDLEALVDDEVLGRLRITMKSLPEES